MQIWTQSISGPRWSQDRNASLWLGDTPPFSLHSLFLAPPLDLGEAPEPQTLAGLGQGKAKMRTDNHSFWTEKSQGSHPPENTPHSHTGRPLPT